MKPENLISVHSPLIGVVLHYFLSVRGSVNERELKRAVSEVTRGVGKTWGSLRELRLFHRMVQQYSKQFVNSDLKAKYLPKNSPFELALLVPMKPPRTDDIKVKAKLKKRNVACGSAWPLLLFPTQLLLRHCGNSAATLQSCGRCRSVYYCNATCQRADWPNHKPTCSSTVEKELSNSILVPILEAQERSDGTLQTSVRTISGQVISNTLPGNVHGTNRFVMKVTNSTETGLMISHPDPFHPIHFQSYIGAYDEPRQLHLFIERGVRPTEHAALVEVLQTKGHFGRNGFGRRIFLWALRLGPNVRLFFDELPPQDWTW